MDLESTLLAEGQPSDRWTARGSNPPRVACKASLHPSAQPWRRTSRGRLSPGAHVPASSERQDSNLHGLGSRPSSHPLTHALSSLGSRRGSNPHLPVHSGMCRTTTSTATSGSGQTSRAPARNRTEFSPSSAARHDHIGFRGNRRSCFHRRLSRLLFGFHRAGRKRSAVVGLLGVEPSLSG